MKQLIVLIAMIILGIAIGVLIMGFSSTAERIKNKTDEKIINSVDGWLTSLSIEEIIVREASA
ncbi:MAG: hypothetical protein IJM80_01220 [Firmicutes bacterium]|nr:hypothetical protein [Bacillota bacterium]